MKEVQLLYKCNNILGEGINWSAECEKLIWLDINNISKLYSFDINSNNKESFDLPEIVTATSVKSCKEIILASNNGLNLFDLNTRNYQRIIDIEKHKSETRSNDGASDALGRFWFGTMQNNFDQNGNDIPISNKIGKLYRVDIDKKITIIEENLGIPNTFVWSPDNKKFYFTDSLSGIILNYDFYLESGEIKNKQKFANFDRGVPDGSTIDTDGCIWNCRYGGSCIVRFDPNGKVDQLIEMPVKNITNCIFGGSDMKTLFITTASNKGNDQHELDGSIFSVNLNYQGLEDHKSKININA